MLKRLWSHVSIRRPKQRRNERVRGLTFESLETRCLLSTTPAIATIREATAAGPETNAQAGIQATVDAFRADLGNPNNGNAVGSQGTGRRQITWDGGDNDAAPARLPADFFNAVAPRGAVFGLNDPRIQFQVSADATPAVPGTPAEFGNVNATYPTAFSTFSSPRLFAPLNTNVLDIDFFIPGTNERASVSGFGAVFTDVDVPGSTRIDFFGTDGAMIFSRDVLATAGNESLSFLGVSFVGAPLAKVRITLGEAALGPDDVTQMPGNSDIVVLDDFIYGEPQPLASRIVVGVGRDAAPQVRVVNGADGQLVDKFLAYEAGFRGGVRVAAGDVTGDGVDDIVTAPGRGRRPLVRVFDGVTLQQVSQFLAFPAGFRGGVSVAVGNVNGDATMDIIVGREPGKAAAGTPQVRVFSGADNSELFAFNAFAPAFAGGVRVAAGDVTGDFLDDIIVGQASRGSRVRVFDATTLIQVQELTPFGPKFRGGVFVAAGEFNGDGIQEIAVGKGARGQASNGIVRIFDVRTGQRLNQFRPFGNYHAGIRVSTADLNGDGKTDLLAGVSRGRKSLVRVLGVSVSDVDSFFAFDPAIRGGVFVAGID